MDNSDFKKHTCSATGCTKRAIGKHNEEREVPPWRHPADHLGWKVREVAAVTFYCKDHESAAKAVPDILLSPAEEYEAAASIPGLSLEEKHRLLGISLALAARASCTMPR